MTRIKLPLPQVDPVHNCQVKIRVTDLNYGNHLGNQVILEYCHEARLQYLTQIEQSETKFLGLGLIMADSIINYKSEGFWGETIQIQVFITDTNPFGFDIFYLLKTNENKEIARVKTGLVFFDYEIRKLAKAPVEMKSVLFKS